MPQIPEFTYLKGDANISTAIRHLLVKHGKTFSAVQTVFVNESCKLNTLSKCGVGPLPLASWALNVAACR